MTEDPGADDTTLEVQETPPSSPPEKMGLSFYAALALIGLLVLMVVFLNYPAERANAGKVMAQKNWILQSYTDATGTHLPVISGSTVTARFGKDGRMAGYSGCNGYSAMYTTKDYTISLSFESVTSMLCWGPGIRDQESAFLADLSAASSFRVSESYLKFYDSDGKIVLVFVPA